MLELPKHCSGCKGQYYGSPVGAGYCSAECHELVRDELVEGGKQNRAACDEYDKKVRAAERLSGDDEWVGGSAHQALERAETTSEEPDGKPTLLGKG